MYMCRAPVVQAVLPLRRGVMGGGRSGPAEASGVSKVGPQCPGLETSLQQRRNLHARQVGVPLGKVEGEERDRLISPSSPSPLSSQYASWDLAFHMLPFAKVDPEYAKQQLVMFLREWYMAPNGQIPGRYEPT